MIRKATPEDIPSIMEVYKDVIKNMREVNKINQGKWGVYPTQDKIEADIQRNEFLVYVDESGGIIGNMLLNQDQDEEAYKNIPWEDTEHKFYCIHRMAVHPSH